MEKTILTTKFNEKIRDLVYSKYFNGIEELLPVAKSEFPGIHITDSEWVQRINGVLDGKAPNTYFWNYDCSIMCKVNNADLTRLANEYPEMIAYANQMNIKLSIGPDETVMRFEYVLPEHKAILELYNAVFEERVVIPNERIQSIPWSFTEKTTRCFIEFADYLMLVKSHPEMVAIIKDPSVATEPFERGQWIYWELLVNETKTLLEEHGAKFEEKLV
jgi:hypothetical protein